MISALTVASEKNVMDFISLAKGIYLLRIQSVTENVVRKLVIE
ncbi:T9SS type A sorting domain-containing protein [Adhaeribacter terrigena]